MNENLEKIDFSRTTDESFGSFYNFSKNPSNFLTMSKDNKLNFTLSFDFNFSESVHLNFNLNNIFSLKKAEGSEAEKVEIENLKDNTNDNYDKNFSILPPNKSNMIDMGVHESQYIVNTQPINSQNYEDFNDVENYNLEVGYQTNDFAEFELEEPQVQSKQLGKIEAVKNIDNLSDKFKIIAIKHPNNSSNPNQKSAIKEENFSNPTEYSQSSNLHSVKKTISKEFFIQQINSLGSLNRLNSQVSAEINGINDKLGILSDSIECPDYASFSDEKLKDEMKKYGLKPGSNKFMVKQLKLIWSFINTSKYISNNYLEKLPDNLKSELSEFLNKNINEDNNAGRMFNNFEFSQSLENNNDFCKYSNSVSKAGIKQLNDIKKEKIISAIQEEKELWTKILTFCKIEIKDVKEVLNKRGIIIDNESLREYLGELGVIFNNIR